MTLADHFTPNRPVVLAGAGKMGGALLSGWLAGGMPPKAVRVVDPSPPPDSAAFMARAGMEHGSTLPKLKASVLVVAVKPQMMGTVLPALAGIVDERTIVISIAAGTTIAQLRDGTGARRIVRTMPNTPAQIGKGVTVAVASDPADLDAREVTDALLQAAGTVEWVNDEKLIDAVTAVSGSGPAYVFLLAETLAEAGVAVGLEPTMSRRLADATVAGAGALLAHSREDPAVLRKNVTSPGGTTAAALAVLMADDGLPQLMRRAVQEAKRRAEELARPAADS
ncbi:MAG: pyrroline-5-carboxylate reductase [Bauldia sp.]|nr:pyrroline-5-carboxylate reductase [Bauldia sp.]